MSTIDRLGSCLSAATLLGFSLACGSAPEDAACEGGDDCRDPVADEEPTDTGDGPGEPGDDPAGEPEEDELGSECGWSTVDCDATCEYELRCDVSDSYADCYDGCTWLVEEREYLDLLWCYGHVSSCDGSDLMDCRLACE